MDTEEYYFRQKYSKQQKFEGRSKRKGSTLRGSSKSERSGKRGTQQIVTKFIKTTEDWNVNRINEYCERILDDGGICEDGHMPSESTAHIPANLYCRRTEYRSCSVKKKKGWNLRESLRERMLEQIYSADTTAPDISIVERTARPTKRPPSNRNTKNDVTRVTLMSKCDDGNKSERSVVERTPKKTYSYATDLMGYSIKKKENNDSKKVHRPEVMYEFLHTRGDVSVKHEKPCKTRSYFFDKYNRSVKNAILEEYCDAIESGHNMLEDKQFELDNYGESETEIALTKNVPLEFLLKPHSRSKQKKKNSSRMDSECSTKTMGGKPRKGNVIKLPDSDVYCTKKKNPTTSEPTLCYAQIKTDLLEEFHDMYSKKAMKNEDISPNSIFFANVRPYVFVAPLGEPCNTFVESGHLLFHTNYDPNKLVADTTNDEIQFAHMTISLLCNSKNFTRAFSQFFTDASSNAGITITDAEALKVLIANAKRFALEIAGKHVNPCSQDVKFSHRHQLATGPSLRECRTRRLNKILRGIAENLGVKTEYISLDDGEQMNSRECDEDFDYEFIDNFTTKKDCNRCGLNCDESYYAGFALERCRHWFCLDCWSHFTISHTTFDIECPEQDCHEKPNKVTKLLLWNLLIVKQHNHRQNDKKNSPMLYDCSNCSGITKMTALQEYPISITSTMVTCLCGSSKCVDCEKDAHWPVSCNVAAGIAEEIEIVKRKQDFLVRGKTCPKCTYFIVKNGGCHNMQCFCGTQFCWNCLRISGGYAQHNCTRVSEQVLLPTGHTVDIETAKGDQDKLSKHIRALASDEIGYQARIRAMKFLSNNKEFNDVIDDETLLRLVKEFGYTLGLKYNIKRESTDVYNSEKHKQMMVVEDLLLIKNQLHYVIPWTEGSFTYGILRKQTRQRIKGLIRKMESLCCSIEWALLTRDYESRDTLFTTFFRKQIVIGKKLIKDVSEAFYGAGNDRRLEY
ncbi:uncharacterized protein LOC120346560 isoform X2 [Styela clava]